MRLSSKISACRRELNSHNAALPRATGLSWRNVEAIGLRRNQSVPGFSLLRGTGGSTSTSGLGAAYLGGVFRGWLTASAFEAHRCLTPRSSRAPTAGHQARSGGTRYIFASPGLASHRRCRLNSNVRRQKCKPKDPPLISR